MKKASYQKFAMMMATSFIIMYAAMFLNVDQADHIMLSITRTYMALLMVAPMAISMMLYMGDMYENKKRNGAIIVVAAMVFFASLYGLRNQSLIQDVQYMKAMIPHHSSAIMVSEKANLQDPETQALAKQIIESQKREIEMMKQNIQRLEQNR